MDAMTQPAQPNPAQRSSLHRDVLCFDISGGGAVLLLRRRQRSCPPVARPSSYTYLSCNSSLGA